MAKLVAVRFAFTPVYDDGSAGPKRGFLHELSMDEQAIELAAETLTSIFRDTVEYLRAEGKLVLN